MEMLFLTSLVQDIVLPVGLLLLLWYVFPLKQLRPKLIKALELPKTKTEKWMNWAFWVVVLVYVLASLSTVTPKFNESSISDSRSPYATTEPSRGVSAEPEKREDASKDLGTDNLKSSLSQ